MSEEKFRLFKLFMNRPKISLTNEEMAKIYGESVEVIDQWILEDLRAGMFFKNPDRSDYYLTLIGLEEIYELKGEQAH